MTYLDVWRQDTFQQVSALPITNTDHKMTECSTSDSLGDISWIQKLLMHSIWNGLYSSRTCVAVLCGSALASYPWLLVPVLLAVLIQRLGN